MGAPSSFSIARQRPAFPVKTEAAQPDEPKNPIYGIALGAFALLSLAYSIYQSRYGTHMKAFRGDLGVLTCALVAVVVYYKTLLKSLPATKNKKPAQEP